MSVDMNEVCEHCSSELEAGQIGQCDDCQSAQGEISGQLKQQPLAYLRASDLERLAQKHVGGCAASLSKEPGKGLVAIYGDPLTQLAPSELLQVLAKAERFLSGFEEDESQEGIDDLLARIRAVLLTEMAE